MGKFKKIETSIEGVYVIEPTVLEIIEDTLWKHIVKKNLQK